VTQPDEHGLYDCPHCTDAVVDLDEHLTTCTAAREEKLAEARRLLTDEQQRQDEACRAEIEAVLAKYGRRLQISQPQITIVPQ
jgi:predicted anti-sigma-YlaC factor YlaD